MHKGKSATEMFVFETKCKELLFHIKQMIHMKYQGQLC